MMKKKQLRKRWMKKMGNKKLYFKPQGNGEVLLKEKNSIDDGIRVVSWNPEEYQVVHFDTIEGRVELIKCDEGAE